MREHPHFLLYGLELEHFEIGKRSCFWWMEAKSARPGWRIDEYSKKRIKTLGICKTDKGSERGFGRESREEDVCVCETCGGVPAIISSGAACVKRPKYPCSLASTLRPRLDHS